MVFACSIIIVLYIFHSRNIFQCFLVVSLEIYVTLYNRYNHVVFHVRFFSKDYCGCAP